MAENQNQKIDVSVKTFFKCSIFLAVGYCIYLLLPFFMVLFLAILLAITLEPLVIFLNRFRIKRGLAVILLSSLMIVIMSVFVIFILPPVFHQMVEVAENSPKYHQEILRHMPNDSLSNAIMQQIQQSPSLRGLKDWFSHILTIGQFTAQALISFLMMLVISIYLLLDGKKAYAWGLRFFSDTTRKKIDQSSKEISKVVFAYVSGQIITSIAAGLFSLIVLSLFNVPAALALAVLAAVFDVLPIIGFFLFSIPAVLLALTVSPSAALLVLTMYVLYHLFENYILVPKVYGNRMRLSSLAVLLGIIIGGAIAGIPGAVAVLPLIAAYPIIENVWLQKYIKTP